MAISTCCQPMKQQQRTCSGACGNATPLNCRALLHYYFAAAGNSSFAQLALGYRHAHGLGVPKSCQSAVGACRHAGWMCVALIGHTVPCQESGGAWA